MAVNHYENFPVASVLLPARLRRPVQLIYAFARQADDFADEGDFPASVRLANLSGFTQQLNLIERGATPSLQFFVDLADVIHEFDLPTGLFHDLLSAFSQDVEKTRYADFSEVMDYCKRSANPVGRLLLHLYRATDPRFLTWSDNICSSLQLINFWQDVAIDRDKGRVYLPQDSLARFGFAPDEEPPSVCDHRFRELLRFEVGRTRAMMHAGAPLTAALPGRIGWELSLVVQGGLRILDKIELAGYDVFLRRPVLGKFDWTLLACRAVVDRVRRSVQ